MSLFKDRLFENHIFQSTFDIKLDSKVGLIEIIDLNHGGVSVSNDMDNILNALQEEGVDLEHYRVMYRNSRGFWESVVVADYEVLGARFVPATTDRIVAHLTA